MHEAGVAVPTWVLSVTDAHVHQVYRAVTVERGRAYARQRQVRSLTVNPSDQAITAEVAGGDVLPYQVRIVPTRGDGTDTHWSDTCSCPMHSRCKHAVATLLAAQELCHRHAPHLTAARTTPIATASTTTPTHRPPLWEVLLTAAIADPAAESHGTELALMCEDVSLTRHDVSEGRWRIHVLKRNPGGDWNRTPVRWEDVEAGARIPSALRTSHCQALREIYALHRLGHTGHSRMVPQVYLDHLPSALWDLLHAAVEVGVELLNRVDAGTQAPVRLGTGEFVAGLDVVQDKARGGILLRPTLTGPDGLVAFRAAYSIIGSPAHGVVHTMDDHSLLLTPFTTPVPPALDPLMKRAAGLPIPGDDAERFLGLYAPRLARRITVISSDDSVEITEATPPTLRLRVQMVTATSAMVSCGFAYQLTSQVQVVGVVPEPGDIPRDSATERAILTALAADVPALASLATLPAVNDARPTGTATPALREALAVPRLAEGVRLAHLADDLLPLLAVRDDVTVQVEGTLPEFTRIDAAPVVRVSVTDPAPTASTTPLALTANETTAHPSDWFDLGVRVDIGEEQVPLGGLLKALAAGDDFMILDSGSWFALDHPALDALRLLISEAGALDDLQGGTMKLSRWQLGLWEELASTGVVEEQSQRWRDSVGTLLRIDDRAAPDVPPTVRATLRPYQVEGFHWLTLLWEAGLGGILADDMGLGKTLQTLAMVDHAHAAGELQAPVLVVAPTSVVSAWLTESRKFTPHLNVVGITQTEKKLETPLSTAIRGADVVITSYTLLRMDADAYVDQVWSCVILDEAQFVKNHQAKTYQVIRQLRARMRLAITGTPLENSLMDLWSLLSIAAPGVFPNPKTFVTDYRKPIESGEAPEQLQALKRRIRPLMLRRTKEAVATELPPKQEQVLSVPLNDEHQGIYDSHLQRERQRVLGLLSDLGRNRIQILASLTKMRQLALDPALIEATYEKVGSAKLDLLVEHLAELAAEGHRALVFSQFTTYLKRARQRLSDAGISTSYLDGSTRNRPERIQEFKEGDATAFLISLKAGGFGLTLTEADYVYVLDPWWNPAAEAQAIDRTHRIGQTNTVMVYRLVSANTVEEKVVALQQRKRALFDQVIGDDALATGALTVDDIRTLLEG